MFMNIVLKCKKKKNRDCIEKSISEGTIFPTFVLWDRFFQKIILRLHGPKSVPYFEKSAQSCDLYQGILYIYKYTNTILEYINIAVS